ncbi:MAG TPA: aminoacyl-tRNA hydrolase [Anaerolineales bacterium]|nr:aminoacyl-tRNA hydrolase [Anaerolineales bacterium]
MHEDRFLIAGLGNPGRAFRRNRHNVGFIVLDHLAAQWNVRFTRHRFEALLTDGAIDGRPVILAKPQTYMNLVGRSVAALARYFRIPNDHVLIIFDDLDLPMGTLRLRGSGGSAGHKGLTSILEHLGTQDVPRLRVGISRPPGSMDPADYVLQDFSEGEWEAMQPNLDRSLDCIRTWIVEGIAAAMNRFNPPPD